MTSDQACITIDPNSLDFCREIEDLRTHYSAVITSPCQKFFETQNRVSFVCTVVLKPQSFSLQPFWSHGIVYELLYSYNKLPSSNFVTPKTFCRLSVIYDNYFITVDLNCKETILKNSFQNHSRLLFYLSLQHVFNSTICVFEAMQQFHSQMHKVFKIFQEQEPNEYFSFLEKNSSLCSALVPWTQEEQKRLEEALACYGSIQDSKIKWKKVSDYVSLNSSYRSPKQCAQQFIECRELLEIKKTNMPKQTIQEEMITCKDSLTKCIVLQQLEMKDIFLLYISVLRVQGICNKCHKPCDMELKFQTTNPSDSKNCSNSLTMGEHSKTCKATFCTKCSSQHVLNATVEPITQQASILAHYDTKGFGISSVMPFDIYTECSSCSKLLLCQNVLARVRRTIQCSTCFRMSHFFFESIHVDDAAPVPMLSKHLKQHPKIKQEVLSIKINTPLPLNGACQHYKKSFRWLRFPCCGKVFPCDLCHNANIDHKCEWANRMICGHCSREQAYSNKPCICGGNLQQGKSSHWEGGKGCRNTVLMNRHDSKKYRGLTKTKPKP